MRPRSYSRGLRNRKTYANANANAIRQLNEETIFTCMHHTSHIYYVYVVPIAISQS